MAITKRDLEKLKDEFDPEAREFFLTMSREEQLSVLFSIGASNSNRLAIVELWQINFQKDNRLYREKREQRENGNDDVVSITQKILRAIEDVEAKKFNFWVWFRDRVLPTLMTGFLLALLILVYSSMHP